MARRGRVIDRKDWIRNEGSRIEVAADAVTPATNAFAVTTPLTILRTRGHVGAAFDETVQTGDRIRVTWALGIFASDVVTAGGAFQDPLSDDYPWLWWGEMLLEAFVTGGAGKTNESWGPSAQRLEVDSRAMRRMKVGEALVMLAQTSDTTGAPVTALDFGSLRVLVGL